MSKLWMKDNKLLIKDNKLLLAAECCCGDEGDDEPCTGVDPLCSNCECVAALPNNFYVTLSGFPSDCYSDTFNGYWTLSWLRDCTWRYEIDEWFSVQLLCQAGPFWILFWGVKNEYGGYFGGFFGEECGPETQTFYPHSCNAYGCEELCNTYYDSCVAVVER